jgi:hypothetical protein
MSNKKFFRNRLKYIKALLYLYIKCRDVSNKNLSRLYKAKTCNSYKINRKTVTAALYIVAIYAIYGSSKPYLENFLSLSLSLSLTFSITNNRILHNL